MDLVNRINAQLIAHGAPLLIGTQAACIEDRRRVWQAAALLQELSRRHGFLLHFTSSYEFGPLEEDAAYKLAEQESHKFDAVAVDEMATDDTRSYGRNEYYVTGFNGPDAILAAICKSSTGAYWAAGKLVDQ